MTNPCPSCGRCNEDTNTNHIVRCPDPDGTTLYKEGASAFSDFLKSIHTPIELTILLTSYIRGRGSVLFADLITTNSPFYAIAKAQDFIGFDNLLLGRLPRALVSYMSPILARSAHRGFTADIWAWKLSIAIELLLFTHRQWTYRNTTTHFKPPE